MARQVIADISGVERLGLDAWLAQAPWPVSETEFHELSLWLLGLWENVALGLAGEDAEILLCDGTGHWLLQHAHAALVAALAEAAGSELLLGEASRGLYAVDWAALAAGHTRLLAQSRWRLCLRRLARNVVFSRALPPLARVGALLRPGATALGSNDPLRQGYVRQRGLGVDNLDIGLLAAGEPTATLSPALRHAVGGLASEVCAGLSRLFGATLDADRLRAVLEARVRDLLMVRRAARGRSRPRRPLLVTESAKPLHKAAACGWREGGGEAVGFHHGSSVGEFRMPERAVWEYFAYDEFVCNTQSGARCFAADWEGTPLAAGRSLRFTVTALTSGGASMPNWRASFPRRVRRVMLIGFPMSAMRYSHHAGLFWPTQLELEVRLVRRLLAAGFEVVYKVHPERARPVGDMMAALGCRVEGAPFEQVLGTADAFVFKYTVTSTFAAALLSDRPIYLLVLEREAWNPAYREQLARRCVLLPAEIGPDGRVAFDEQALLAGLAGEQTFPDYSYVSRYYLDGQGR